MKARFINEAIKHLSPRSEEEVQKAYRDEIDKVPLYFKLKKAEELGIKIGEKEHEKIISDIKKEITHMNKLLRKEVIKLNKTGKLNLFVPQDDWFNIIDSRFMTYATTSQFYNTIENVGDLSLIMKKTDVTYRFSIIPERKFTIELQYSWNFLSGTNGYDYSIDFDKNGKKIE